MRCTVVALSAIVAAPAFALSPAEVFEKVSPSVWAVRALDAQEKPFSFGSGVVVGPGQVVTACRVLARARSIQVRRENVLFEAKLEHADVERDLCLLSAPNFAAPPAPVARPEQLKIGQRIYAVTHPERMAATLAEGLITGLRDENGQPALQTSAALARGASGGGLFNEDGALVGIAVFDPKQSTAIPAQWIAQVADRSREALVRRAERQSASPAPAAAAAAGLPAPGTSWRYSFQDRKYGGAKRVFTVRVAGVQGADVREAFAVENGPQADLSVDANSFHFVAKRITSDYQVMELAPYFFVTDAGKTAVPQRPSSYPGGQWELSTVQVQPDDVSVAAGTFKASRVQVSGRSSAAPSLGSPVTADAVVARFNYTAWYAPDVGRYVMVRHQTWNRRGEQIGDEVVELLDHKR